MRELSATRYILPIFFIFALLQASSCIDRYDIDVPATDMKMLVVDPRVNLDGDVLLILQRTADINTDAEPSPEANAKVTIEDESGNQFSIAENAPGRYEQRGLSFSENRNYRLHIRTRDGREYASAFVPFKRTPPIDSVSWKLDDNGLNIYVNTHDPTNNTRYYRWKAVETWQYETIYVAGFVVTAGDISTKNEDEVIKSCYTTNPLEAINIGTSVRLSDDVIREHLIQTIPWGTRKISVRYSIEVEQQALTEDGYNFWNNLQRTNENLGGLFDPLPFQVVGNITCTTNPDEKVIGFFSGSSISNKRIFIRQSDMPIGFTRWQTNCQIDTVMLANNRAFSSDFVIGPFYQGITLMGFLVSTSECTDCRQFGGTTTKPDFW